MIYTMVSTNSGAGSTTINGILSNTNCLFKRKNLFIDIKEVFSLDLILSLEHNISLAFYGSEDINNYIIEKNSSIDFLKVSLKDIKKYIDYLYRLEKLKKEIKELDEKYDNIIISIDSKNINLVEEISDSIILVFTQENISIRYLDEIINKKINEGYRDKIKLILNKYEEIDGEILVSLDEIYDMFEYDLLGVIPYDNNLRYFSNTSKLEYLSKGLLEKFESKLEALDESNIDDNDLESNDLESNELESNDL